MIKKIFFVTCWLALFEFLSLVLFGIFVVNYSGIQNLQNPQIAGAAGAYFSQKYGLYLFGVPILVVIVGTVKGYLPGTKTKHKLAEDDDFVSVTELTAFTGDAFYVNEWTKYHNNKSVHAGWNGSASLYGAQWFFYRKLYIQGIFAVLFEMTAVFLLLHLARALLANSGSALSARDFLLFAFLMLLVRILIGYWANIAFYDKAISTIKKVDALNLDNEAHLRVIKNEGGVNFPAALLAYCAYMILWKF